jgi:hypothetical protein
VVDYSGQVWRERAGVPYEVASHIDLSLSFDLPQHGWDLALATGQDASIDPDEVDLLRASPASSPWIRPRPSDG